ncbi:FAD binding domain-containing protein [Nocardioides humi]|uniref:Xanthine dehydrogenase family protein subunit M n=1 Tax=Nocardioides humi TaxID=449461 RepID=A0ABN2ALI7_9ACTN|nr:xanthine dehydrogenase family protein subunit M [Nocardioides humi]
MYPGRFRYVSPRSIDEAIAVLTEAEGEGKVLAGGQSLIPLLKLRFASPGVLVDINNLPDLDYIRREDDGSFRIGALTRHATMERSASIARHQPTAAAAAPLVADPIVRNRGTLVGSVCHADPQGDWAAVMIAAGGSVVAQGPEGRRTIPVRDFVTGPFQNVLAYDEVAVEAVIPAPKGTVVGGFLKLERRVGDFATAGAAVTLELSGGKVSRAGIALTGVGAATIDAEDAANALLNRPLGAETIDRAATLAAEIANPKSDHRGSADYKRHVVHTFVRRILAGLTEQTERAA